MAPAKPVVAVYARASKRTTATAVLAARFALAVRLVAQVVVATYKQTTITAAVVEKFVAVHKLVPAEAVRLPRMVERPVSL